MGKIITVCGEIDAGQLGFTSMHEHTINDPKGLKGVMGRAMPGMMAGVFGYEKGRDVKEERARREALGLEIPSMSVRGVLSSMKLKKGNPAAALSDREYYGRELEAYKEAGGKSLCDCSPLPTGFVDIRKIKELAEKTGIQIVCGAGYYISAAIEKRDLRTGEAGMQAKIEHFMEQGDPESGARPGFGKCAIGTLKKGVLAESELTAIRATAYAAKHHGMCLHIHTAFPARVKHILTVADMLEKEIGVMPERVIFCHMDSYNLGMGNPAVKVNEKGYSLELPKELLKRGFTIGLDTWSSSGENGDTSGGNGEDYGIRVRIEMLLDLLAAGYASRITLGHDMMSRGGGVQNGGGGYVLWPEKLKALVKRGAVSSEDYQLLTVGNPARILALDGGIL